MGEHKLNDDGTEPEKVFVPNRSGVRAMIAQGRRSKRRGSNYTKSKKRK